MELGIHGNFHETLMTINIGKIGLKQRVDSPWVDKIFLHRGKIKVVKEGS